MHLRLTYHGHVKPTTYLGTTLGQPASGQPPGSTTPGQPLQINQIQVMNAPPNRPIPGHERTSRPTYSITTSNQQHYHPAWGTTPGQLISGRTTLGRVYGNERWVKIKHLFLISEVQLIRPNEGEFLQLGGVIPMNGTTSPSPEMSSPTNSNCE